MKRFIKKDGASNYYLTNENGMGGGFNPPGHAEHNYSIIEKRGGHEVGSYSLSSAAKESWIPKLVQLVARKTLDKHPGTITEDWIRSVYSHFQHCYSPDGIDRDASHCICYGKFWDNADKEQDANPEHHLGYLFVKQFDPNHTPRLDLIRAA